MTSEIVEVFKFISIFMLGPQSESLLKFEQLTQ
jgi:hypothetical protein